MHTLYITQNYMHNTTCQRLSKVETRKLFSSYCVAALSVACSTRTLFTGTNKRFGHTRPRQHIIPTVNAFVPTISSLPFGRYTETSSPSLFKMSSSTNAEQKRVLVPIADGSEEIETACITDTLTRFGAKVTVASVKSDLVCTMSRGLKVMADCTLDEAVADATMEWDMIVLPGGMPGAEHLRDCTTLQTLLQKHVIQQQKPCGAICAAPAVVLASSSMNDPSLPSLLSQIVTSSSEETVATCYPAPVFRSKLSEVKGLLLTDEEVVWSGNLITSQGPATALDFSLELGEVLYGEEKRNEIAKAMLTK